MAELKTKVNNASVDKFLRGVTDETKREDSYKILEMIKKSHQNRAQNVGHKDYWVWDYHYKYESRRKGDYFRYSPRVRNLTLYMMGGVDNEPTRI